MRERLRTTAGAWVGMQSDKSLQTQFIPYPPQRHSLWSVSGTARFWITVWSENNDFYNSCDSVCTITAGFEQRIASRRRCCTDGLVFSALKLFLQLLPLHVLSSPLVAAEMVCTLCSVASTTVVVSLHVWSMLHALTKPVWCKCTPFCHPCNVHLSVEIWYTVVRPLSSPAP